MSYTDMSDGITYAGRGEHYHGRGYAGVTLGTTIAIRGEPLGSEWTASIDEYVADVIDGDVDGYEVVSWTCRDEIDEGTQYDVVIKARAWVSFDYVADNGFMDALEEAVDEMVYDTVIAIDDTGVRDTIEDD